MSLSAAELSEMRKRANAASPGPWLAEPDTLAGRVWVQRRNRNWLGLAKDLEPIFSVRGEPPEAYRQREQDALFVAAARTDVPRLLDEIDRLTAQREKLRAALGDVSADLAELGAVFAAKGNTVFDEMDHLRAADAALKETE